jgi:hypothetical protein
MPGSPAMPAALPSPDRIFGIGCGFRASKVLLSAIELDIFTILSEQSLDAAALMRRTGLQERGARDFFDALVALGMLERGDDGLYANAPEAGFYLDRRKPSYIGALFEQYNAIGFGLWNSLTQALRTGSPQTGITAARHCASIYADAAQLRTFVKSMTAGSLLPAKAIAAQFPWEKYRTFIDIGTAEGCLPVEVALAHPAIRGAGFDLPELREIFETYVREHGLAERLQFHAGNFFESPLPPADVVVYGRILHNWDLDTKRILLGKAYEALPKGGVLIVHESLVPDDRRSDAAGLLASLNMLLWTAGGFDFSGADCVQWMRDAGFRNLRVEPLAAEQSMVVGEK